MKLRRQTGPDNPISIVSMIDVLMILLVFFMVTSSYLRLGMVPLAERAQDAAPATAGARQGATLLVRLAADGGLHLQGRAIGLSDLAAETARRLATDPGLSVLVLPSGQARTQALVGLMDALAAVGVSRLGLMTVEGRP